ncbi:amidohydrolase [Pendulispora rubella]|uniref:Amidohydrolase n=1 Tax=Pendulispora rubella TaxID=2741070 RepID=A0ABZ2LFD5_9BACT
MASVVILAGIPGCTEKEIDPSVQTTSLDDRKACTLFYHGKIFTGEGRAEAIGVCGSTIAFVGHARDFRERRYDTVDLGGRTVVPGIDDAHAHVLGIPGTRLNTGDFVPGPGPALDEVKDIVRRGTTAHPPGTWLVVTVGEAILADPDATRFALDPEAPDHPVVLRSWTGHGTVINTQAMRTLGISETEPDPFGGRYVRVAGSNVLDGVVQEYAEHLLNRRLFERTSDAELVASYRAFAERAVRVGYTSIQDIPLGLTRERAAKILSMASLPIRVRSICFPLTVDEACDRQWPAGTSPSGKTSLSGLKWITDGTPLERNAFLEEPYADAPDFRGVFNFSDTALRAMLRRSLRGEGGKEDREQPIFHTVGDGALDDVLDAARSFGAKAWRGRRFRIEHGDLIFPRHFAALRSIGATVVQNPLHLALPDLMHERLGPVRASTMQPLRSLLERGIGLAFGTDSIGAVASPWLDMYFATTHPTHPSEAISLEQALVAYTRGAAYVEFADHEKGTLAPGMLADFAVLSQDIFRAPPEDLPSTTSVLTVVDGQIVWDSGEIAR